jgi:hypothetical protein
MITHLHDCVVRIGVDEKSVRIDPATVHAMATSSNALP